MIIGFTISLLVSGRPVPSVTTRRIAPSPALRAAVPGIVLSNRRGKTIRVSHSGAIAKSDGPGEMGRIAIIFRSVAIGIEPDHSRETGLG
ncbi:MAG: hypothetical protein ACK5JR_12525 [Tropicimonas sp.]|uniref:hypothetical protein n=1 Tax=Tropicimonas sp. TaxID=2067044 RepID=UPI003A8A09BE